MYPYRSHFISLEKYAKNKDLKEVIQTLRDSDIIQGDVDCVIGALTYIGNVARNCGEQDVCDRARGIRDYIRSGG